MNTEKQDVNRDVISVWRCDFPDFYPLDCYCSPCLKVYGHRLLPNRVQINGLVSNSPLADKAFYSWELAKNCSGNKEKYLNLYQVQIPDFPGKCGKKSTVQVFTKAVQKCGLDVNGKNYKWDGAYMMKGSTSLITIYVSKDGMCPIEFSKRIVKALRETLKKIKKRSCGDCAPKCQSECSSSSSSSCST